MGAQFEMRADYWAWWSGEAERTGSRLYAKLAASIAGDETLKTLAAKAQKGQPHANMLLGSVHYLLLRGTEHPLAQYYPSCGGRRAVDGELFPHFRDFVDAHRGEIESLLAARVTNTNEVGRSAVLHPAFRFAARASEKSLRLIEIGPSAGLNMIWDRYGVHYRRGPEIVVSVAPGAALVLACELKGTKLPPTGPLPKISSRVGLELNPVNIAEPDAREWLGALIWPDDTARRERFEQAATLFLRDPVDIRAGDAVELLSDALSETAENEIACVYHTIALYQFGRERREAIENMLIVAGVRRPVIRIALEQDGADVELTMIHYHDGAREETPLAISHPHGRWLEWRA